MKHQFISIVVAPGFIPEARTVGEMRFALCKVAPNPPAWLVVRFGGFKGRHYFNGAGYQGQRTWL